MGAIVWIASYPRSGNTWTRNFLHNVINLIQGRETDGQDINDMGRLTTWEIYGHWYEPVLGKRPGDCGPVEISKARHAAQQRIADEVDKLMFTKTHHALVAEYGRPTINTKVTAGAIYIVRNPLDCAISFANHFSMPMNKAIDRLNRTDFTLAPSENNASEVYGSWAQNVVSWTRKQHRALYIMRYEDMLENPVEVFGKLARHLLLPASEEQIERAVELSSFERLKKQEEAEGFRERPEKSKAFFRAGKAGQWREELKPAQVRKIIRANHAVMKHFGYIPEDYADVTPPPRPRMARP